MATLTKQFTSDFHSIPGLTIGERRKNLRSLLNHTSNASQIEFLNIVPTTPLEETFWIGTLIHFQRVPELMNVLTSATPHLINIVLKESHWFLPKALASISGHSLVNEIFALVSFNVRIKVR